MEDLTQDMIFYYPVTDLKPIKKIYENVEDVEKTYELLKGAREKIIKRGEGDGS